MPRGAGRGEFGVDVTEWMATTVEIGVKAKLIQPVTTQAVRRAARTLASRSKVAVMATPRSGGGGPHSGLRGRIRDGIRVEDTINGADIKSTGQLARQYDAAGGWRHPVYGNDVWVTQEGTEYFITVIAAAGPEVGKPMILAALSAMFRF
jgi:hypothetical protein